MNNIQDNEGVLLARDNAWFDYMRRQGMLMWPAIEVAQKRDQFELAWAATIAAVSYLAEAD